MRHEQHDPRDEHQSIESDRPPMEAIGPFRSLGTEVARGIDRGRQGIATVEEDQDARQQQEGLKAYVEPRYSGKVRGTPTKAGRAIAPQTTPQV
jgi:hypothetical protein